VLALSWSGGKDSALALHQLRERSGPAPRALITTVTADYGRISMHGVRRDLLSRQARAVGLPLVEVDIPAECSNDVYEQRMGQALAGERPPKRTETSRPLTARVETVRIPGIATAPAAFARIEKGQGFARSGVCLPAKAVGTSGR
jgi:diphthamide synthase (EF-2-diphthine--ammonia ligase)